MLIEALKKLIVLDETGQLSHRKLFSFIGYIILCWAFIHAVLYGSKADDTFYLYFSIVVVGNHTIASFMRQRVDTSQTDK